MTTEKVDKHKAKLKGVIHDEVTVMFEKVLDYTEVAVTSDQYKRLRSKILRVGNNCIRNINKEIDARYNIEYNPPAETIVEVRRGNTTKVKGSK